jgi:hypothetical protein
MKVIVTKPFPYAADGINAVPLAVGDEPDIHDNLVPGLVREGFVRLGDKAVSGAPERTALFGAPENKSPPDHAIEASPKPKYRKR